jgi:hypothetical protein
MNAKINALLERVKKNYSDDELVSKFNLRPMRWLQNGLSMQGEHLEIEDALAPDYDITPVVYTDLRHSTLTEQDANVQIVGSGGSGKSATGMHYKEADYSLKGRIVDYGDNKGNYPLVKFLDEIKGTPLEFMKHLRSPGLAKHDNAMLDEAGQNVREGALSHSLDAYLNDIEQIMRAKCVTKFFCSWLPTTNSYQYILETWDLNRRSHEITLLAYMPAPIAAQAGGRVNQLVGHVVVPFPTKELYDAYFSRKMENIDERLLGHNKLAWEKWNIAKGLKKNASFQLLNKSQRINFIERNFPQFLTRSTWVVEIEEMARIPGEVKKACEEIAVKDGLAAASDYLARVIPDDDALPSLVLEEAEGNA